MKKIVLAILFLSLSPVYAQMWKSDFDAAMQQATLENKKVLLFFSVPEYCENCTRLEQNIFRSSEFNSYAQENYILLKIDFSTQAGSLTPEQKQKNLLIVEKYNKDGFFPYVVILNKDAKVLGNAEVYKNQTPLQFLSVLKSFTKV